MNWPGINLETLSRFAHAMANCLGSALPPRRALELSAARSPSFSLRRAATFAGAACDRGHTISEGLEPHRNAFPRFFLPLIQAGELGGRQVESYQLVHEHCERLKPALALLRQAWLYPLICILTGWAIRIGLFLYFGMTHMALLFARDTVLTSALLVAGCWALLKTRILKEGLDALLLQIPFVRKVQIRLAMALFFATFRLAYEAGGLAVLTIFDLALQTVGNLAIRKDLLNARAVLEVNGAFEDAFNEPALIEDQLKSSIAAGALSGHLGTSLGQIVKIETTELELSLDRFNRIFQRLVALSVTLSIVGTLLLCLSYSPK